MDDSTMILAQFPFASPRVPCGDPWVAGCFHRRAKRALKKQQKKTAKLMKHAKKATHASKHALKKAVKKAKHAAKKAKKMAKKLKKAVKAAHHKKGKSLSQVSTSHNIDKLVDSI